MNDFIMRRDFATVAAMNQRHQRARWSRVRSWMVLAASSPERARHRVEGVEAAFLTLQVLEHGPPNGAGTSI